MTAHAPNSPSAAAHVTGRLITLSALYGTGGSVIAPMLAERLGVPFMRRCAPSETPVIEARRWGERLSASEARATPVHRLLACLSHAAPAGPTQSPPPPHTHQRLQCGETEADIHRMAATGEGVILGRGAAVVLGKVCGYHVRLDGPPERRVARGAAIEGIAEREARRHMRAADKARAAYVSRLYGVDPADPSLYHLVIDSTVMPVEAVVELILMAARDAAQTPAAAGR
jgi:cytidylate kinase